MNVNIIPTRHVPEEETTNEFIGTAAFMVSIIKKALENGMKAINLAKENMKIDELQKENKPE